MFWFGSDDVLNLSRVSGLTNLPFSLLYGGKWNGRVFICIKNSQIYIGIYRFACITNWLLEVIAIHSIWFFFFLYKNDHMTLGIEWTITEGQEWCSEETIWHSRSYTQGELINSVTLGKWHSFPGRWSSHLWSEGIGLDYLQHLSKTVL